jgi:hypothetical protein
MKLRIYAKHQLIALDQLLNTFLGGWPDGTLSSRAYRWHRDGARRGPMRLSRYLPPELRHPDPGYLPPRPSRPPIKSPHAPDP